MLILAKKEKRPNRMIKTDDANNMMQRKCEPRPQRLLKSLSHCNS